MKKLIKIFGVLFALFILVSLAAVLASLAVFTFSVLNAIWGAHGNRPVPTFVTLAVPVLPPPSVERLPGAAAPIATQPPPSPPSKERPLDSARQADLQRVLATAPDGVSISVTRIEDGLHAEVHAAEVVYAASLFKLSVLYEAERERSAGEIDFATMTYPDFSEDLGTSGELPLAADGSLSISDALFFMVTVSDNASGVGLMRFLGTGRINDTLRGLGILNTSVNTEELPTTAADMARLMRAIVTGEGVDSEARAHMRQLLMAQTNRFGVPSLLPAGTSVGNKTGTWNGALHDVAFVETSSRTYVVAVLTDGSLGWDGIAEWSRRVFEVLDGK